MGRNESIIGRFYEQRFEHNPLCSPSLLSPPGCVFQWPVVRSINGYAAVWTLPVQNRYRSLKSYCINYTIYCMWFQHAYRETYNLGFHSLKVIGHICVLQPMMYRPCLHKLLTINNYVNCPSNFAFARSIYVFHPPIFEKILTRIRSIISPPSSSARSSCIGYRMLIYDNSYISLLCIISPPCVQSWM